MRVGCSERNPLKDGFFQSNRPEQPEGRFRREEEGSRPQAADEASVKRTPAPDAPEHAARIPDCACLAAGGFVTLCSVSIIHFFVQKCNVVL